MVSDLIGELEATAGSLVKNLGCEGSKSHQEPLLTDWSLPQGRRHHSPPKTVRIDGKTISPGRFQVLQGIREEGEIPEEEGDGMELIQTETVGVVDVIEIMENTAVSVRTQGPNQNNRGKNKSGWRPIANTKDLIHAAVHNQIKKASLKKH